MSSIIPDYGKIIRIGIRYQDEDVNDQQSTIISFSQIIGPMMTLFLLLVEIVLDDVY